MFEKEIVIDAKGHIMGRLAANIAKELLSGQRIVVVRVEQVVMSGSLFRRKTDYMEFLGKANNKNPRRGGPYHFKAPARLFWRTVRGMLPHKLERGKAALERLKVFEGMPHPYSQRKRVCVPTALRVVRLGSNRKSCQLHELSTKIGWNQAHVIEKLEAKREVRAKEYFAKKQKLNNTIQTEVDKLTEVQKLRKELAAYGY